MSGIAGIIRFDGGPVEQGLVERMTGAMSYRGPDGIHHWTKGSVALGHCMLRTTPESLEETQPLTNEDENLVLVMDGWLSNWEELRCELLARGANLRTRADAELVLRSYEQWSRDCLAHIDGDFAFVIWDARKRSAFCARDRTGRRPFYYWRDGQRFAFASDLHALLVLAGSPREIDEIMVAEHLEVRVDNLTNTLIRGIKRLAPATYKIVSRDKSVEDKYWQIDCHARLHYRDEREYLDNFLDLFQNTVRRHLRAIGPVGFLTSGGLDSSSLLCVAARMPSRNQLKSYSLVFPGEACDESAFIDMVNAESGLAGEQFPYAPTRFVHFVERIKAFTDLCDGPNGAINLPIRFKAQADGVRAIITGHGGDEWFGTNGYYYADLIRSAKLRTLARQWHFDLTHGQTWRDIVRATIFRGLLPALPAAARRFLGQLHQSTNRASPRGLTHPKLAAQLNASKARCLPGSEPAHRWLHTLLNLGWNVRGKEISNRETAAFHSDEREPFYDRRLIEFAFALPETQRSPAGGKLILRESLRGVLPEPIRARQDKAEFSSVLADTLALPEAQHWLRCERLLDYGWIDADRHLESVSLLKSHNLSNLEELQTHLWPIWMAVSVEIFACAIEELKDPGAQSGMV
jgi:asparagine synthase (glutamine-hydrolysing)